MLNMERNELITYLENIRNLETLSHYFTTQYQEASSNIFGQELLLRQKEYVQIPVGKLIRTSIISAVLLIAAVAVWIWGDVYKSGYYNGFIFWMAGRTLPVFLGVCGFAVFFGSGILGEISNAKRANREAAKHNETVCKRTPDVNREIDRLNQLMQFCAQEYKKVRQLLDEAYAFNIIPAPYRNLTSAIYIYDYMSTSGATLEETLMHSHMEDGIQKITSRLDTIIRQNMQMLQLQRIQIQQNAAIHRKLESIGTDTKMAAHFARVNSYILAADYLKK